MSGVDKPAATVGVGSSGVNVTAHNQGTGDRDRSSRRPPSSSGDFSRGEGARDAASFLGIAAEDLTPPVHRALHTLIADMDALRRDLAVSRERQAHWLALANGHPLLPMMNHRALIRELELVIEHLASSQICGTLVIFSLVDLPFLRGLHGLAAAHAAATAMARYLLDNVRSTDIVGCLGDTDFAVVLALTTREHAERKADQLAKAMAALEEPWGRVVLASRVSFGVRQIEPHDTPERLINDADSNLRARSAALFSGDPNRSL